MSSSSYKPSSSIFFNDKNLPSWNNTLFKPGEAEITPINIQGPSAPKENLNAAGTIDYIKPNYNTASSLCDLDAIEINYFSELTNGLRDRFDNADCGGYDSDILYNIFLGYIYGKKIGDIFTEDGYVPAYKDASKTERETDCSASGQGFSCLLNYLGR